MRAWPAEALPTLPWPEQADLADKLPFWREWQKLLKRLLGPPRG